MYMLDSMVLKLAKAEIDKWPDKSKARQKIFITLTVGVSGLDTVDELNEVAKIVAKIPVKELKTITWPQMEKLGYKW
jgi:hypothetical protein